MTHADQLRRRRTLIRDEQRAILDAYDPSDSLSPTDQVRFDELDTQARTLQEQITRHQREHDTEQTAADALGLNGTQRGARRSATERALEAQFRRVIASNSREPIEVSIPSESRRAGFQPGIERRALTLGNTPSVGVTFFDQLNEHLVDNAAILAAGATVIQTETGEPLRIPRTSMFSTASIITEGGVIPQSDPALGSVDLGAFKYGFLVKVSTELSQDAGFDLLGFLARQAGIAIGNAFGKDAISGDGVGKPRGILLDTVPGVTGPTGTATSLGAQTTAGQGGDLLADLYASVRDAYARSTSAAWIMNAATLNTIRKLRDTTGNYVFNPEYTPGTVAAGTLLGRPVFLDPNMPTPAAGVKSIAFGDFSTYYVRQVGSLRFERSDDFAFDTDQVVFRALARLDGASVDGSGAAVKTFRHSAS